ncbi:MAG: glycosyltransferase [Bacteriovoracaceae bacterium]
MNILLLLPRVPYPTTDGASKANFQFIQGLTTVGVSVKVMCISDLDSQKNVKSFQTESGVKEVFFYQRKVNTGFKKLFDLTINFITKPHLPVTYQSFFKKDLLKFVLSKLNSDSFDLIIAITPHAATPLLSMAIKIPFLYRSDNVEYELWEKRALEEKNPFLRFFLKYQEFLVKNHELSIIKKACMTLTIAEEDKKTFLKALPDAFVETIPMAMIFPPPTEFKNDSTLQLFFLGRLDWGPNRDGLVWFLKEVWPEIKKLPVLLSIAGSGHPGNLEAMMIDEKIHFLGKVPELKSHFEKAHIVLVPIFYGSGTRIKVLEASLYTRACLSTAMGIQGSPLVDNNQNQYYLAAENKEEWIEQIRNCKQEDLAKMGLLAYEKVKSELDFNLVSMRVLKIIQERLLQLRGRHQ